MDDEVCIWCILPDSLGCECRKNSKTRFIKKPIKIHPATANFTKPTTLAQMQIIL